MSLIPCARSFSPGEASEATILPLLMNRKFHASPTRIRAVIKAQSAGAMSAVSAASAIRIMPSATNRSRRTQRISNPEISDGPNMASTCP